MPVLTLVDDNKTLEVPEGTNLRKFLLSNHFPLYQGKDKLLNCLGNGLCGTCRVEVVDGKGAPALSPPEEDALLGMAPFYGRKVPKNVRLACCINVTKDMSIKRAPKIEIDPVLTKERLVMSGIWTIFGGSFLYVIVRLLVELATGA